MLDLFRLEFIFFLNKQIKYFYFLVERTALNQLKHEVKRVLGLKDFIKLHSVLVVELSHDFDFFNQTLFAIFFAVSCFF